MQTIPLVYENLIRQLPKRDPNAHKGSNGHVCVVGGGSCGYSGAVLLAGESALRAGAGLVSIAAAEEALPLLARGAMELMCHPIGKMKYLRSLLERADLIVLGPGLGQTRWSTKVWKTSLETKKPCVIDADGLNLLAQYPQKRDNWILTPHPKEAARLLKTTVDQIQSDRISAIRRIAEQYGGTVVLKGAGTLVFQKAAISQAGISEEKISQEKVPYIETMALPVLGTAGTGDVLAGLIGGLWVQGLPQDLAAQLGVSVHSNAAQIEMTFGDRGMLASDLFLHIRGLVSPPDAL